MIDELGIFVLIATILKSCVTNINVRNNLLKSKYYKGNMETVFSRRFGSYLYKAEYELRMRLQDTGITVSIIIND
ncbi:MAG: hypothetical protein DBO98_04615 [Candidatus Liberibacter europaeus]|nr:hypothetical protein [Candidatus Liberibacter europaeus]